MTSRAGEPAAPAPLAPFEPDPATSPAPDPVLEPQGFVVGGEGEVRIHFHDWGGPADEAPGVLLVPGLLAPAWTWASVARRLARVRRTVVADLRGHGLSDSPPDGYDLDTLAEDAAMVAEAAGLVEGGWGGGRRFVVAGHGFGACVAAALAVTAGERCAGLVLVDGGFERLEVTTGLDVDEFLRDLDEPPEVLRSMGAWLDDRRSFDPASWDDDQRHAARDAVVETAAGHVVRAVRPHVVDAVVRTMFAYDPAPVLAAVEAPIAALVALAAGDPGPRLGELRRAADARFAAGRGPIGVAGFGDAAHNLPRHRPAAVASAILGAGG
jgi:pimeloyl-ACP methyl ester carboxylesterase